MTESQQPKQLHLKGEDNIWQVSFQVGNCLMSLRMIEALLFIKQK